MESNEEKCIKIYVKKDSPLYKELEKISKDHHVPNVVKFIEANGYKFHVMDTSYSEAGGIKVETIGNEKQICILWNENNPDTKRSIIWYKNYIHQTQNYIHQTILNEVSIDELKQAAGNAVANINNEERSCKISCRTQVGLQPSIRITFPDENKVTFYQDGWCNGPDKKSVNIHKSYATQQNDNFIVYKVGKGDNEVTISYRYTGNKSIKITNKKGDGVCVYPDYFVNPVKNGQTTTIGSQRINCNLFEFIENNFFKVDYNKSKSDLKKPLTQEMQHAPFNISQQNQLFGGIHNIFNNQHNNIIQNVPNNNTLYSLNETNEFTIKL